MVIQSGVDLSTLTTQAPDTFVCQVPDGCGLTLRSKTHLTLQDCVLTTTAYTKAYIEVEPLLGEYEEEIFRLRKQNADLLAANQRLAGANHG